MLFFGVQTSIDLVITPSQFSSKRLISKDESDQLRWRDAAARRSFLWGSGGDRIQSKNNYLAEKRKGSEKGSYLRLIDFASLRLESGKEEKK